MNVNSGICGVKRDWVDDHSTSKANFHFSSWPTVNVAQKEILPVSINKTILVQQTRTVNVAKTVANALEVTPAILVRKCHREGAVRKTYTIANTRISRINTDGSHNNVPHPNSRLNRNARTKSLCSSREPAHVHNNTASNLENASFPSNRLVGGTAESPSITLATIRRAASETVMILKLNSVSPSTGAQQHDSTTTCC